MAIYVREGVKIYVKFHACVAKLYIKFSYEVPKPKHNLEIKKKKKKKKKTPNGIVVAKQVDT